MDEESDKSVIVEIKGQSPLRNASQELRRYDACMKYMAAVISGKRSDEGERVRKEWMKSTPRNG